MTTSNMEYRGYGPRRGKRLPTQPKPTTQAKRAAKRARKRGKVKAHA